MDKDMKKNIRQQFLIPRNFPLWKNRKGTFTWEASFKLSLSRIFSARNRCARITIIIPTLNEERCIKNVILELYNEGFNDILVIDGNSADNTTKIAKKLGVTVILQTGQGKGQALRQAFQSAALGDFIIMMDADGSMNPKELPSFLFFLANGMDVVKGSRFMSGGFSEDISPFRRIGNSIFTFLVNLLWGTKYTDLCYGYAGFRKEALIKLSPSLRSKSFEIETEIFIKAIKMGLKVIEVPSVELRRKHGKSNLNSFLDGFRILRTILLEAFC